MKQGEIYYILYANDNTGSEQESDNVYEKLYDELLTDLENIVGV